MKMGVAYEFYFLERIGHGAWENEINGKSLSKVSFNFIAKEQNFIIQ